MKVASICILGDLNGLRYQDILKHKNCGHTAIIELRQLIRKLQTGTTSILTISVEAGQKHLAVFVVPDSATEFLLSDLPLPARLEKVLRHRGYTKLGDVNGVRIDNLLHSKNCGKKSINELQDIIQRARDGEFTPINSDDICSTLKQITEAIDAGVAKLNYRNKQIFEARIGGVNYSARTLENIAQEFSMTRERVRQIIKKSFEAIRRGGGLRFKKALQ